jgi:hypothetical protein
MANPFLRRATEYIRDAEAFLSIVSPAPLTTFLAGHKRQNELFDHPIRIIGSPGTGKTMLATLAEFRMVETILSDLNSQTNRPLARALADAGIVVDQKPHVAAVRVPMESEYRDFWELPYPPHIKTRLAFWLLQARALLGLIRGLTANGQRALSQIRFRPRADYDAHIDQIGGLTADGVRRRALAVERAIYSVGSSLVPPKLEDLPEDATSPYDPFDAIEAVEIDWNGQTLELRPLAMLDDVHELHHEQLAALFDVMSRREMRFGRWMMMRLDALSPSAVLQSAGSPPAANRSEGRDFIDVRMQVDTKKADARRKFRSIAQDIANRYLPMIETFRNRDTPKIRDLLSTANPIISKSKLDDLRTKVDRAQEDLEITTARRQSIEDLVSEYVTNAVPQMTEDVGLEMVRILMHRYDKRRANSTPSLFDDGDPDPKTPLEADRSVAHGAMVHLHHMYKRPLHFGIEALCDASNENAEIFLNYAGALVAEVETRAIRRRSLMLSADVQQTVLGEKARAIIDGWPFAQADKVRQLVRKIAADCVEKSLEPNASLDAGANAVAILESDFESIPADDELLLVLKHALANGAITIERNYGQGGKLWCLIELTGTVCLAYGLTFLRGGFLPKKVKYLREAIVDA